MKLMVMSVKAYLKWCLYYFPEAFPLWDFDISVETNLPNFVIEKVAESSRVSELGGHRNRQIFLTSWRQQLPLKLSRKQYLVLVRLNLNHQSDSPALNSNSLCPL